MGTPFPSVGSGEDIATWVPGASLILPLLPSLPHPSSHLGTCTLPHPTPSFLIPAHSPPSTRSILQGSRSKSGAVFTIGVVGRCLSKTLVEGKRLMPKCRELVLAAAPKVWG